MQVNTSTQTDLLDSFSLCLPSHPTHFTSHMYTGEAERAVVHAPVPVRHLLQLSEAEGAREP